MAKEVYGKALRAYFNGDHKAKLTVMSDVAETDYWPLSEFFHSWDDMCGIERRALTLAHGRTLDAGAGSGSHSLWLQGNGVQVDALDISPESAAIMRERGVSRVIEGDFYSFEADGKYDTLLFLMNGVGLAGSVDGLDSFLSRCKSLLAPGGQILMDSSNLIYLYENEDGSFSLPLGGRYYGELTYTYKFRGLQSDPFDWVFVDQETLEDAARRNGLKMEIVLEGDHYDYLARLVANE